LYCVFIIFCSCEFEEQQIKIFQTLKIF